jgi:hypothetical protein
MVPALDEALPNTPQRSVTLPDDGAMIRASLKETFPMVSIVKSPTSDVPSSLAEDLSKDTSPAFHTEFVVKVHGLCFTQNQPEK